MDVERKIHVQEFHIIQNRKINEKQISLHDHWLYPNLVVSFTWSRGSPSLKLCLGKWFCKLSSIIFWKPKFYFKICLSISLKYSGTLCAYFLKSHLCTYSFCSLTAWALPLKLDLSLSVPLSSLSHLSFLYSLLPFFPSLSMTTSLNFSDSII